MEYWSKEGKLSPALIEATCSEVNDPQHSKVCTCSYLFVCGVIVTFAVRLCAHMPFPHSLPYSLPPPLSLSPSPFYYYFEEGGGSHAILACWQYYCFEAVCDVCVLSLHVCVHCTPSPYMCVYVVPPLPTHVCVSPFSQPQAAWILLSEMSQYTTSIQNKFILGAWKQSSTDIVSSPCDDTPFLQVVTMIGNVSRNLGKVAVGDIKGMLYTTLMIGSSGGYRWGGGQTRPMPPLTIRIRLLSIVMNFIMSSALHCLSSCRR